LKLILGNIF
jgi:hypothetical protein